MARQVCWKLFILVVVASLVVLLRKLQMQNYIPMCYLPTTSKAAVPTIPVRLNTTTSRKSTTQMFPWINTSVTTAVKGSHSWFENMLLNSSQIQQWSTDERDAKLHKLSHWNALNALGWRNIVNMTIAKLDPPMSSSSSFTFFELGVGVGAFSRRLLLQYPLAKGVGVDIVEAAVNVARTILPADRMALYVVSNSNYSMIPSSTIDHIIAPGVICYLPSLNSIVELMKELVRIARTPASMSFTMLPYATDGKVSCNLVIPPSFWSENRIISLGVYVTNLQNMSDWNSNHSYHRYAVFLRKQSVII